MVCRRDYISNRKWKILSVNVVQRSIQTFGVSVGELSKMITNQDKLNNMTEGEKKSRDMMR